MASDFIAIDPPGGIAVLSQILAKLPITARDMVVDDVSKYLLDILRTYPPQKRVTRLEAFGKTFFSARQRRYFFYALEAGIINLPYSRTQTLRRGWKQIGRGAQSILANETPYAALVMGDGEQSRMAVKIGWKAAGQVVDEKRPQVERRASAAADKAMRKLGAQ